MRRGIAFLLFLVIVGEGLALAQQPFTVSRIEVLGNQNVPTREILKAVGFKAGDTVDAAQVKEAGDLVPGHGGVLDRLDSVVFTIPVVYYLVVFALGR